MAPIPMPPSTSSMPATSGPPKRAEIAAKPPALASTLVARSPAGEKRAAATPTTEPSAITGASGPSTAPKGSVPSAASGDTGRVGDRGRRHAETLDRRVASVARQQQPRGDDDRGTGDGDPDDEVPRRRRVPERVRQVVPQPVLEVVDEGEEERSDERGRDPDRRPEQHEAEVRPPVEAGARRPARRCSCVRTLRQGRR